jgi:UDP-GlcNAc:undecaprenyl-phosphate GlcNAc-1-phosphate transferase
MLGPSHPLLVIGAVGFVASLILASALKPIAGRLGAVAHPKADRWHRKVIPLLGGLAIAGGVVIGCALAPPSNPKILILLAAALALCLVGVVDDLRPVRPQSKFIAQIVVASALAALGLRLTLTDLPLVNVLITIFWIVGITNAFNLLDNMDGLAAGVAAITVSFWLVFFSWDGNVEGARLAALLVGACLGFLVYNFNPASIFMGDAGSLFLGVMVSGLSLVGDWAYSRNAASVLLFPVLILLVPIFDTTLVTVARMLAGRSVSTGGRDHSSHRLVALGISERGAVLVLYVVAALSGAVAFLSYRYGLSYSVILICLLAIGLGLFGIYLGRLEVYPESQVGIGERAKVVSLVADFPYKRQIATVLIDVTLIVVAYYTAYVLRFENELSAEQPYFIDSLPIVLGCQLFALAVFRVYRGLWRYTGLRDLIRITQATSVGTVAAILVLLYATRFEGYSRAVFVIDWVLVLGFVGGSRIFFRALDEILRQGVGGSPRVLIYGAGDGGVMVAREIRSNRDLNRDAVGFLDDDRDKHGTRVLDVPVLGGMERLEDALLTMQISEVIISTSRIAPAQVQAVLNLCEPLEIPVRRALLRLEHAKD